MRQLLIKDERGQLVAFIGSAEEFGVQPDAAKVLGESEHRAMAWIDWIESSAPGNGTKLMEEALILLEAEGVGLIGLEVVPKDPGDFDRIVSFYEKFGFVYMGLLNRFEDAKLMLREASWNGIEP